MVLVFVLVDLIWVADEAGHWKPRPPERTKESIQTRPDFFNWFLSVD